MAYSSMPNPEVYRSAIRSGLAIWYTVDAELSGVPVAGATDLAPTGGTITDTSRPGVRRVLTLELAPDPGLFDRLSPIGTQLSVTAHIRYSSRDVVDIPMGVFVVDSEKIAEGGGSVSLTAPDKWSLIQRARFIRPQSSTPGTSVAQQIATLIRGALGAGEVVNVYATSGAIMGAQTWEKDRDKAILDLAKGAGVWVYFDRDGVATVADLPTASASADWLVDASANGVLTSLDRERSRADTHNVVVVESSAADAAAFPTQVVWDNDPSSPTYAGTDPINHPELAGPFGVVPYFYDTPLPLSASAAWNTGRTILARVSGLASQVSLGQVPNQAVDAFDVIDVMPPGSARSGITGYTQIPGTSPFGTAPFGTSGFGGSTQASPIIGRVSVGAVLERHVAETVTHPLTVGPEQQIEGRSTRTEEIEP